MPTVKFKSIDEAERTVAFDIDGVEVSRSIPVQFEGTIDDYVEALASGLMIEYADSTPKSVTEVTYKADEVVASDVAE